MWSEISMKHLKAYLTSFESLYYYKVGLRLPFEYASINKISKSFGFMVSHARHCIRARGNTFYDKWINVYPTIMFFIHSFGHNKTI
jgi:hypothetical protein